MTAKVKPLIIKVDALKKEVRFDLGGSFTEEEAVEFMRVYQDSVNRINPSEYTLVLDCEHLRVVAVHMLPSLEACFELYKKTGFKHIIFNLPEIVTLKMQINRLNRKYNLENCDIRTTYPKPAYL